MKLPSQVIGMAREGVIPFACAMNPDYKSAHHQSLIAAALQRIVDGTLRHLIITMPPRHGKSMLVAENFIPFYLGRFPKRKVIYASYATDFATRFGQKISDTMMTAEFKQIFPDSVLYSRRLTMENFSTISGGECAFTGVNGQVTGKGAHLLVIDDPHKNWEEASSETMRQKVKDFYHSVADTRMEGAGAQIVIHTRWHADDLIGYLLDTQPGEWEVLNLPALDANDKALWEEGISTEEMHRKRRLMPPKYWWSLYMQEPTVGEGTMVKRDWFWLYDAPPTDFNYIVQSWDTAQKTKDRNAFSVCLTWGVTDNGYYLLDEWRNRVEFPDLQRAAEELASRWGVNEILVEDQSTGQSLIQGLQAESRFSVTAIQPTKRGENEGPHKDRDKIARMSRVLSLIQNGRVFLPKHAPFTRAYMDELCAFPDGKFADRVDATTQFLNWAVTSPIPNYSSYRGLRRTMATRW